MEKYWIVMLIPIFWFIASITYQLMNLFYLWLKFKLQDIKNKEYQLWD